MIGEKYAIIKYKKTATMQEIQKIFSEHINKYLEKIMPLENIIKEARLVENVHNLIKNNNKNFEINEVELEAANVLA